MLLGEPTRTPYDLRFGVFGFPVRVSPFFWLAAVCLGAGPHMQPYVLLLWIAAVFLSILIHELGHAVAYRRFGQDCRVVLYHFGGLAIPQTNAYARPQSPWQDVMISLAGPAMQLLSAGIGYGLLRLLPVASAPMGAMFLHLYVTASVAWALLNLAPVYPLDGGQVARNLLLMRTDAHSAIHQSLLISVVTSAVIALYGFSVGRSFLGIMFVMLGYSSYQAWQSYSRPY